MEKFYDEWYEEKEDSQRNRIILKWKVINMANLVLRNILEYQTIGHLCDIGGGNGVMADFMDRLIGCEFATVFDISKKACEDGRKLFPDIPFVPEDYVNRTMNFIMDKPMYDLIILSDITEHVEDDVKLLEEVARTCEYAVLKMPLENCFFGSKLFYCLQGKKKPKHLVFGENHYNGHLRGYSIFSAKRLLRKHFKIIDFEVSKTSYFYKSKLRKLLSWLPKRMFIRLFGGALFVLVKPK